MRTIILKEKDFKDEIYCGRKDLSNIEGNLEIEKSGCGEIGYGDLIETGLEETAEIFEKNAEHH